MNNAEKNTRTRRNTRPAIVAAGLAMLALVLLFPSAARAQCMTPPTFAGIETVTNPTNSTCTLTLMWNAATPTCGGTITYSIYRGTVKGFTPGAANRIASDVSGTTYSDNADLVSGTRYYYVVRARSSANWVEETNAVEKSGTSSYQWSTPVIFRDDFDANRPTNPTAWWTFGAFVGDNDNKSDIFLSDLCGAYSPTHVYRFGAEVQCKLYSTREESSVILGGNGSIDPAINGFNVPANVETAQLRFWHKYALEPGHDGGHLMYSIVGPLTGYVEIPDTFTPGQPWIEVGDYDAVIPTTTGPVRAWTGSHLTWSQVVVNIAELTGKKVWFVWRFSTDKEDNSWTPPAQVGYWFDDIQVDWTIATGSCTTCPGPVKVLTARAGSYYDNGSGMQRGSVKLEWTAGANADVKLYRDAGYLTTVTTAANGYGSYTDLDLNLDTTYAYEAGVASLTAESRKRSVSAKPTNSMLPVKWAYSTGASALTPPGLYPGATGVGRVYVVSNDRSAHAVNVSDRYIVGSGGDWIASPWLPPQLNSVTQGRPLSVKVRSGWTIGSTSYWLFLGSQDGFAYGYDADAGGSPLWRTSAPLGDMIIASPSAWFRMYDTDASKPATDVLLVGTRTTTGAARSNLVGLNPASGAELWRFDNLVTTQGGDGKGLGIISSAVSVDYASYTPNTAKRRAYFATRRHVGTPLGSQDTLWCVEFDSTTVTKLWSTNVGDIDSAPTMRNGIVYVGNNDGQLWAINAATGIPVWGVPMSTGDGPVKGFVWIDGPRNRGYFSTSTRVWAVNLATGAEVWSQAIPSPSTVVSTGLTVYVGAGDGQVYELSNAVSGPVSVKAQMVAAGASIGSPTFDIVNGVMYVGSDAGRIYSVAFPLP